MIEALRQDKEGGEVEDLTASDLLALARDRKAAEDQAAAELLEIAARWADLHPPESIHAAAAFTVPGCEHEEPIAGHGCPLVAEFCIAELGTVLTISTTAAKKLIGHALELRHRLPRLWAQVHAGRVPAWRARIVAEATIHTSPALTVEAAALGRRPGVRGRRTRRHRAARPPRRRDHQTLRARCPRPGDGSRGRLPVRRPPPRHGQQGRRPLRRHPARRGRPRPRRRPRPRPRPRPRRRDAESTRIHRDPRRPPGQGPRRPRPHPDRPRPLPPRSGRGEGRRTDSRSPGRSSSTRTSTPPPSANRRSSVPPVASRKANASPCSTRSRAGAVTPAPRSPSSPSSTSPPSCRHRRTPSRTGSANRSFSATAPACSPGAPDQPVAATSTTSSSSTTTPQPRADHNPARQPRRTSPHSVATTTASRPSPPGRYRMVAPGVFEWTSPHGHHYRRDRIGTTRIDEPDPPERP